MLNLTSRISDRTRWIAFAAGSAIVAGFAARALLKAGWRASTSQDPPLNPASRDTDWADAAIFSASVGLAAGLARLVARRYAAAGWERVTGRRPPAFNES